MDPAWNHRLGWASLRLAALLGFAMLAPAALPAGGAERRVPEVRRRESFRDPLLTVGCESLRCAPRQEAPALVSLEPGVPLRVLRSWGSAHDRWLQVEAVMAAGEPARGWLSI
ncbi:SH3 domain-containing protein [Cyanobium sp. FGCU-52]|nr:SH3 domain-containing protein [Cyanobium sp. FGCU52]